MIIGRCKSNKIIRVILFTETILPDTKDQEKTGRFIAVMLYTIYKKKKKKKKCTFFYDIIRGYSLSMIINLKNDFQQIIILLIFYVQRNL